MSFFAQEHRAYVRIGFESCFTPEEAQLIRKYIGLNNTALEKFLRNYYLNKLKDMRRRNK